MLTLAALGCAFAFQTTLLGSSRPWRNDQNGLLDHLALKGSKSSLCQVQLCIKVVPFQKQEFWVPKSQCIPPGLGVSGKLWRGSGWALARLWTALDGALEAALERIWKALDGFDGFRRGLDSSGRLWTALDGSGRLGKLWMAAWSLLAACRMSEIMLLPVVGSIFC